MQLEPVNYDGLIYRVLLMGGHQTLEQDLVYCANPCTVPSALLLVSLAYMEFVYMC